MCSVHLHYALTKPPQQQKYLFIETSFSSGTSHVVLRKKTFSQSCKRSQWTTTYLVYVDIFGELMYKDYDWYNWYRTDLVRWPGQHLMEESSYLNYLTTLLMLLAMLLVFCLFYKITGLFSWFDFCVCAFFFFYITKCVTEPPVK